MQDFSNASTAHWPCRVRSPGEVELKWLVNSPGSNGNNNVTPAAREYTHVTKLRQKKERKDPTGLQHKVLP